MTTTKTDIKAETLRLAEEAFEAFCNDIEAMFGIEISCQPTEQIVENTDNLKKHFKKLCAVNTVESQGVLEGNFQLILSKEALFTMAGIFVMWPENKILESRKFGTQKQAEDMQDAVKEAGNMLVGAWDRIFRENIKHHKHFKQGNIFIGNPWDNPDETIGIDNQQQLETCYYEFTAGNFPPFGCCVAFPENMFNQEDSAGQQANEAKSVEEQTEAENTAELIEEPAQEISELSEPEQSFQAEEAVEPDKKEVADLPQQTPAKTDNDDKNIGVYSILDLKAIDIMNNNIEWCQAECTVEKALEQMQTKQADYLLVGTEQKAEGIVAMSDLSSAMSIYLRPMFAKWKRQLDEATLRIKVQCIMSKPVKTVSADTPLDVVAEKIVRFGGCLVVTDKDGKTLGIVTSKDFLTKLLR